MWRFPPPDVDTHNLHHRLSASGSPTTDLGRLSLQNRVSQFPPSKAHVHDALLILSLWRALAWHRSPLSHAPWRRSHQCPTTGRDPQELSPREVLGDGQPSGDGKKGCDLRASYSPSSQNHTNG